MRKRSYLLTCLALAALCLASQASAAKKGKAMSEPRIGLGPGDKPNILAIWGDDIGWFNLSLHNHGIMGYKTPNLDRLGREWGGMFTDAYAEQSCTAGRAAFLTGQHGMRTGMIKVGLPGVAFGLSHDDPTIAGILKYQYGYATGQFGKNHLGDTNDILPTTHGFDEFFGNLYHLNAEEEPEHPDYPKDPEFKEKFGPRGVIHSFANGISVTDDVGGTLIPDDSGYGQTIYDTGPLTSQRMKIIDGAFAREAVRFMSEATNGRGAYASGAKPFFVWYAASRMHIWTHLREPGWDPESESTIPAYDLKCYDPNVHTTGELCNLGAQDGYYAEGVTGYGTHQDGMVEHDMYVGQLLDFLVEAGLENDTIVMYTSDNGPETFSWPDGGTTPFRSEKATNWEGAYRVPLLVSWPGVIEPGFVSNEIIALQDWFPTLINAVRRASGETPDIKAELMAGNMVAMPDGPDADFASDGYYKVHLDGYDFLPRISCLNDPSCLSSCLDPDFALGSDPRKCEPARKEFLYANDDGVLVAIRYGDWKVVFHEQREHSLQVWQEPFTPLRFPKLFNLRSDPFEKADHETSYHDDFRVDRMFVLTPAQVAVYNFLNTFRRFPPRQAPPSFSVDVNVQDVIDQCGTADDPLVVNGDEETCFPIDRGLPNVGAGL